MRRALVLLVAVAAALWPAAAASAHAELLGTSPGRGAVVALVHQVVLRFDEPVSVSPGGIAVTGPGGRRVDTGGARAMGTTVRVAVRAGREGSYDVAWRVVSDDGHPEAGAFTFSVGRRSGHAPAVAPAASASLGPSYAALRWVGYAGFCAFAGGTVFLLLCWPAAGAARPTRVLVGAGGAFAWLATWATLLVQGAYDDGTWSHLLRPDTLLATLQSRTGAGLMARLVLLVVLAAPAVLALRWGALLRAAIRRRLLALTLAVLLVTAATWSAAGHESVGAWWPVAVVSDAVHLAAAAVWVGGMLLLAAQRAAPRAAVAAFSRTALPCVAVVAVTGAFQAQRNLPSWAALVGEGYGRLVLVKVAGLVLLAGCGVLARRLLTRGRSATLAPSGLRALVAVEVVVALAVLGVAAVLVQTAPR